jgi:hypothetical protein
MAYSVPPPVRPVFTKEIEAMKPKTDRLFDATMASIKSIVSRVRAKFPSREYLTRAESNGVRVWRTK